MANVALNKIHAYCMYDGDCDFKMIVKARLSASYYVMCSNPETCSQKKRGCRLAKHEYKRY